MSLVTFRELGLTWLDGSLLGDRDTSYGPGGSMIKTMRSSAIPELTSPFGPVKNIGRFTICTRICFPNPGTQNLTIA